MIRTITSASNPLIKSIRKLKSRKTREETQTFYVEGIRAVGEALRTNQEVLHLIYCPELLDSDYGNQLIQTFDESSNVLINVPRDVFKSFALKDGPQGIAAVVRQQWSSLEMINKVGGLWIGLDSVQDPGNLGAILRSSDAVGGKGIILLDDTTDPFHPSSVRASTGAIFTQKIIKASFEKFSLWKSESYFPLIGTYCGDAISYRSYNYPENMILLMGSEQKGLQSEHLEICDEVVTIPMSGNVDSLNLSIAASIVMFEIYAQKRDYPK
ncbi:MAG TPA: RNA methyltransferase [Pelolinea sp.]|nr:RNA methyltransferase [Pelolinea sp.]